MIIIILFISTISEVTKEGPPREAPSAKMDLSAYEKVADITMKVKGVASILVSLLPGGKLSMGTTSVRGVPMKVFKQLPPALGTYYTECFEAHSAKEWLIFEGERISFGEARRIYEALGAELSENPRFNMLRGDRIGIAMRNYPEFLIAFIGITAAGGVAVPFNALSTSAELEYVSADAGCKVMIGDPERLTLCEPFAAKQGFTPIVVRAKPGTVPLGAAHWDGVIASGVQRNKANPRLVVKRSSASQPEDEAMIMYTSGSTGNPKGVVHTHRSVGTAMKMSEVVMKVKPDPDGVQLMSVPLFHITALFGCGLMSIPQGAKVVIMRKWDAGEGLKLIQSEKVTRVTGVPTMMKDLMDHPQWSPEKVVRYICCWAWLSAQPAKQSSP